MLGNSVRKELDEVISNKREETYLTEGTLNEIQAGKPLQTQNNLKC
jgi:hypothetical protein